MGKFPVKPLLPTFRYTKLDRLPMALPGRLPRNKFELTSRYSSRLKDATTVEGSDPEMLFWLRSKTRRFLREEVSIDDGSVPIRLFPAKSRWESAVIAVRTLGMTPARPTFGRASTRRCARADRDGGRLDRVNIVGVEYNAHVGEELVICTTAPSSQTTWSHLDTDPEHTGTSGVLPLQDQPEKTHL